MQLNQRSSLLERKATAAPIRGLPVDKDGMLKVALVHQDKLTCEWAEHVRTQLAEVVGEGAVHCTRWRVSDLRGADTFAQGVEALAQAHAIVIAVREMERLPADFYLWVNVWLEQRHGLAGTLVALIGAFNESISASHETRRYLQAVASQGRLEFVIREYDVLSDPPTFRRDGMVQLAGAA